ncbi:MAG: hypothetical protein JXR63_02385 [Spirochaetales bacterium]|nr:hypothetical protein [Spirochaetales bacterium]
MSDMSKKVLFASVFAPYGVKNRYAESLGMQMELMNNQVTRQQGVHSPRQSYLSFALYLLAENIHLPSTVLDFPRWKDFVKELKKGYSHVAISFIVPNVLKVKRMTEYIRKHYSHVKIILGGYGTVIPNLKEMVDYDYLSEGEGVKWMRQFFGTSLDLPVKHPILRNPVYNYIYGLKTKARGSVIFPGVGCENACKFCITSHYFKKEHVSLLPTGQSVYDVCQEANQRLGAKTFMVLDENFLKHEQRARELLQIMEKEENPYSFVTFSSAENIKRMGVDFMVRCGITRIWVGVESKMNLHDKTKGIDLRALFEDLRAHGIIVLASTILFHDHHDKDTIKEEIDWVCELDTDLVQFMNYTPIPTTELYRELKEQGRIKNIHPRHLSGAGELAFDHPHFKKAKDHERLLRKAFRRKYLKGGPAIARMAQTALRGYVRVDADYEYRQKNSLIWDSEGRSYKKSDFFVEDAFMPKRIETMKREALRYRPGLIAALFFSPNRSSRRYVMSVIREFSDVFGRGKFSFKLQASILLLSGGIEWIRIQFNRVFRREGIIRQPPVVRKEYQGLK